MMNNWQKVCIQINPLIKRDVAEEVYHEQFVSCLQTIFNWNIANIKVEQPVRMGSTDKYADIVLAGNGFGIVIEMKRPSVALGDNEAGQLSSYMRVLGKRYGLLVGNKIKVFYDNDKESSAATEIASFDFDGDNSEGTAFCEILDGSNCSSESITIKGISIPLYKNTNETIQDFVKKTLRLLFANNLLPDSEISNMLDEDYCKQLFGLHFPIIQNDKNKLVDNAGYSRYWADKIFGQYYACAQWYDKPEYINKLAAWIKKISTLNQGDTSR
jgi:hypothetical protein